MTDTISVQDLFTGAAGSMAGHLPNINLGGASYIGDSNWLLSGTGTASGSTTGTPYNLQMPITTLAVGLGVYLELTVIVGRYGGLGTSPPSIACNLSPPDMPSVSVYYNGPGGGYGAANHFLLDASGGVVDLGVVSGPTLGTSMTLRLEFDPYAKTTKIFKDAVLAYTQDDSAYYTGLETFAPDAAHLSLIDSTGFGSGGVYNSYDRIEIGTLGLVAPAVMPFWTNYVNSAEFT